MYYFYMDNDKYQYKYKKYKQKYIELKDLINSSRQSGGYGLYTKYWNEHTNFELTNNINKTKLIFNKGYLSSQYSDFVGMLDNLLNINNGLINLDFINNFYRNIYFDIDKDFEINVNSKTWKNDSINKYTISKYIKSPNSDIVFIQNKNLPSDQKVIKIFTKIDVDIKRIPDYLSLLIVHILNKIPILSAQNNYIPITPDEFELFNFNCQTHFILDQNNNKLYLATRNNDAINDYIVNLILEKINNSSGASSSSAASSSASANIVKYHNLCVLPITTNDITSYRYCIVMDKYDGSIYNLINKNEKGNTQKNHTLLNDIIENVSLNLSVFKNYKNLFTHTDMKCENVFYKEYSGSDSNSVLINGKKYKLYLADFDKSSITYNNIRFYNDISSTNGLSKKIVDPSSSSIYSLSSIKYDDYTIQDTKNRINNFNDKKQHKYRLSRTFRRLQADLGTVIETEQLYMRYNYQPYYLSFDYCSLILSLFSLQLITELPSIEEGLTKTISKYITTPEEDINMILNIYNRYKSAETINGNFGELLNPLLTLDIILIDKYSFNNVFNSNDYLHINKLFIEQSNNKILISLPSIINITDITGNITSSSSNTVKTIEKYNKLGINEKYSGLIQSFSKNVISIDYNRDRKLARSKFGTFTGLLDPSIHYETFYSKTNRFSQLTPGSFASSAVKGIIPGIQQPYSDPVQEIVEINDSDIEKILHLFNTIEQNNEIPKTVIRQIIIQSQPQNLSSLSSISSNADSKKPIEIKNDEHFKFF